VICGLALTIAASAAAQARDFEMGGDSGFPYSIMAPEPGAAPSRRAKAMAHKRHAKAPRPHSFAKGHDESPSESKTYNKDYPRQNLSVVRGSSGSVLPTPLPRTALIPPEGGARLTLPASPQQQGPTVVPGLVNPVPNLPHGTETFQDRASRCAFQSSLGNVPGDLRGRYIGGCVQ
jgi:hypothetical protein